MLGEQEVGGFPGARVGVWPLLAAVLGPGVKSGHGGGIERDGAFGAQFAERDAQPRAGGPVVGDAAELKVKALAQAQPGAAQQQDRRAGEQIIEARRCGHQRSVGVRGKRPGQRPWQAGHVTGEDQPALGPVGPSPQGDVVQEVPDGQHGSVHGCGRNPLVAGNPAAPGPGRIPGQEGFDVVTFKLGERGDGRELRAQERPEGNEVVHQPVHRGPRQHRSPGLHVAGHSAPDIRNRDDREPFLRRAARRAALGRLRELAALEQQLAQAEQTPAPLLERGG